MQLSFTNSRPSHSLISGKKDTEVLEIY